MCWPRSTTTATTCADVAEDDTLIHFEQQTRVYPEYFLPRKSQWNNGAQWVGGDFGILAVGSKYSDPQRTLTSAVGVRSTSGSYPPAAQFHASYVNGCEKEYSNATHITYGDFSTEAQWNGGVYYFTCWIGTK